MTFLDLFKMAIMRLIAWIWQPRFRIALWVLVFVAGIWVGARFGQYWPTPSP